ncbi:hypothetical protein [Streptomyces sp. NPDC002619]|uniref:hypothetical protein n=1 Tax=Streptomyces sp. NPDC002619 TaxID=3364655 RepID=UPI00368E3A8E
MSQLLWADGVSTQYSLISIRDFGTADNPVAETGEEEVIYSPGQIFVASRSDVDGDVRVEVWLGTPGPDSGRRVMDSVMNFSSGIMSVTDPGDLDEESLRLPEPGPWCVSVCVQGEPRPHTVSLFLQPGEPTEIGASVRS